MILILLVGYMTLRGGARSVILQVRMRRWAARVGRKVTLDELQAALESSSDSDFSAAVLRLVRTRALMEPSRANEEALGSLARVAETGQESGEIIGDRARYARVLAALVVPQVNEELYRLWVQLREARGLRPGAAAASYGVSRKAVLSQQPFGDGR
jgi:hypothetical protein